MRMFQVCIPQLQQELAGLKMQTSNVNGWLTDAVLTKPATVSATCATALAGAVH